MKHIEINIGKACNNKCLFCMSSKPELLDIKFVSLDLLKEKIKLYSEKGYNSIGFLGGDVSIHPNLLDIIKFCKFSGFKNINIISNGMVFDDYNLCKQLVYNGLTRINISIHSHLDEIEDSLIQVQGGLQRKLKAIDNFNILYEKGLLRDALSINIVINQQNYTNIIETVLYFWKQKNINDIRLNFIRLEQSVKENWNNLKISYTIFLPYFKKLIYISIKYKIRLTFDTIPACIFYKIDFKNYHKLVKRFLGEDKDHITEIDHINGEDNFDWKERKKNSLKMHFEQCTKCLYKNSCEGVRKEYGEIYGGDEFEPIENKLVMLRGGLGGLVNFRANIEGLIASGELNNGRVDIIVNEIMGFYFDDLFDKIKLLNDKVFIHLVKNFLIYEGRYLNGDTNIEDTLIKDYNLIINGYDKIYLNVINTSDILSLKLTNIVEKSLLFKSGKIIRLNTYSTGEDIKQLDNKHIYSDKIYTSLPKGQIIILDMFTSTSNGYIKNIGFKKWKILFTSLIDNLGGNFTFIFAGLTEDKEIFDYWESKKSSKVFNFINKTDLKEYFYLINISSVIITNESLGSNFANLYNKKMVLFVLPNIYEATKNIDNKKYDFNYSKMNIPHGIDKYKLKELEGFLELYNNGNILCFSAIKNSMEYLKINNELIEKIFKFCKNK